MACRETHLLEPKCRKSWGSGPRLHYQESKDPENVEFSIPESLLCPVRDLVATEKYPLPWDGNIWFNMLKNNETPDSHNPLDMQKCSIVLSLRLAISSFLEDCVEASGLPNNTSLLKNLLVLFILDAKAARVKSQTTPSREALSLLWKAKVLYLKGA